jgi:hypothetical protein
MLYDHYFLPFSPIFGGKMAFSSKTNVMINFLHYLALLRIKNANFFADFWGENIFFNHNIGPCLDLKLQFLEKRRKRKFKTCGSFSLFSSGHVDGPVEDEVAGHDHGEQKTADLGPIL